MRTEKIISPLLSLLLWAPILFLSVLLAHNAILCFTHGEEYGILPEKTLARTISSGTFHFTFISRREYSVCFCHCFCLPECFSKIA